MSTDGESRLCGATGLRLVPAPKTPIWRVFKNQHGPLSPPLRSGSPQRTWGRFDVNGFATLYGASQRKGAFIEALAQQKFNAIDFSEFLADVSPTENALALEWQTLGHMRPGSVPAQWRLARSLAEVSLVTSDWFIDMSSSETLGVLRRHLPEWQGLAGVEDSTIDISSVTGADRRLTCAIASWISTRNLDDGSRPVGAKYISKHGGDLPCWVTWIDLKGSKTTEEAQEHIDARASVLSNSPIELGDTDFVWAASNLHLTCY